MKRKKIIITSIIVIIIVITILLGVYSKKDKSSEPVPQLVQVLVIKELPDRQSFNYSGTVRGRYESQLAFQVSGRIIKRYVELSSTVHQGDALMEIDDKDLKQVVNSAAAQLYSAESQFKLAESNLYRNRQLYNQNAISMSQLDQFESAYDVAKANVMQASAQYTQSNNQLGYSVLRADKDGIIAAISAETGQFVAAGQPILTLVHEGEWEVEINVPENQLKEIQSAKDINISFWALPDVKTMGKVREISPVADQATRTFKVRISILNPSNEIKLGMTAAISAINYDAKSQMFEIPLAALVQTDNNPSVWIVVDGIVHKKNVVVGAVKNNSVEVLSGLSNGDVLVTAGVHKLVEGQSVKPRDGDQIL